MKIATASESRQLDEKMITHYGIPQAVLMENAAIAAREVIEKRWSIVERGIVIICGTGSNGGDGFALARQLHADFAEVNVFIVGDPGKLCGAAKINFDIISKMSIDIQFIKTANPSVLPELHGYDLIVDSMFGTGLSRNLSGVMADMAEVINKSGKPVLALDIPSGINADTGEVMGCAIQAEATVCFGLIKRGNLLYPGTKYGGQLYYSSISFPKELTECNEIPLSLNIPQNLPIRNPTGHKGSFGKILIIGGSHRYCAAPAFSAVAALRTGAGYAMLAVPEKIIPMTTAISPESVYVPMETDSILNLSGKIDVAVLGPGLSVEPKAIALAKTLIPKIDCPLILDADALTILAGHDNLTRQRAGLTVLTPHPGEMARLLGTGIQDVESRRVEAALEAAQKYNAVTVLKGAHSIITSPSGKAWLNLTGNAGMATAGSGDVLAGIIAALLAVLEPEEAVKTAVYLHGMAGDIAAENLSEAGMITRDILNYLPEAISRFPGKLIN